jgi:hypothetical protein
MYSPVERDPNACATGKTRYGSRVAAQIALTDIKLRGASVETAKLSIYRCHACRGLHLGRKQGDVDRPKGPRPKFRESFDAYTAPLEHWGLIRSTT